MYELNEEWQSLKKFTTYTQVPPQMAVRSFCMVAEGIAKHRAPQTQKLQRCFVPRQLLGALVSRAVAICSCTRRMSCHMGLGVSWTTRPPPPCTLPGPCRKGGSPAGSLGRSARTPVLPPPSEGLPVGPHGHLLVASFLAVVGASPPIGAVITGSIFSHMLGSYMASIQLSRMLPHSTHCWLVQVLGLFLTLHRGAALFVSWLCSPWLW